MFYVERGPLSVYFYFGIDFKIKRRTFLDASAIHIPIFFLLSFYSRAFFLRRNFTTFSCYRWPLLLLASASHFVYTILFIYFTASSEFYFAPRARTDTRHSTINSIPARRTHTHSHLLTKTRV